jgi:hypothetical protein
VALLDCLLRSTVMQAEDVLAIPPLLLHACYAVLQPDLAGNTAAAAALACALTSLVKRAVQLMAEAAAATTQDSATAAACFPAAVSDLVDEHLQAVASSIAKSAGNSVEGSCSSSSQASASAALLAVVLARSLVQLADALEAAGPQLYYDCVMHKPEYKVMWSRDRCSGSTCIVIEIEPEGGEEQHTVELQWQYWQLSLLEAFQPLLSSLRKLGMAPAAAAAAVQAAPPPQADVA